MGGILSGYDFSLGPTSSRKNEHEESVVSRLQQYVQEGNLESLQALQAESRLLEYARFKPPLLLQAVSSGHNHVLRYLLELGLDAGETDTCGMSAVHEACKQHRPDCLDLLLASSCDLDKRDVWGRTPLLKALVYRNTFAAKLLLEKGADPNAADSYGMTPLSTAVDYSLVDMVNMLVRYGADLDSLSFRHHQCFGPALYQAIKNQNLHLVRELLLLGASTHPKLSQISSVQSPSWEGSLASPITTQTDVSAPAYCLHYENAVTLAMSELVKRSGQRLSLPALDILVEVLAAHGLPLGAQPEVIARIIVASLHQEDRQLTQGQPGGGSADSVAQMLLLKLHLCSGSWQDPASLDSRDSQTVAADRNGFGHEANGPAVAVDVDNNNQHRTEVDAPVEFPIATGLLGRGGVRRSERRYAVVALHTLARRAARRAMMASGCNVVWAATRLSCPPALKTLLLLKDVDRAFSGCQLKRSR